MFYNSVKSYCPVCKDLLGWRQKDSLADFYCKECQVNFYWHPKEKWPTNNKMDLRPKCGCNYCSALEK